MRGAEQPPIFVDLFSEEAEKRFRAKGTVYRRKIEPIRGAEHVTELITVKTCLPDGTEESVQDAKPGDWIITGSKGEHFVLSDTKFHGLYTSDEERSWIPRERRIIAMENYMGVPIITNAPWSTSENPATINGSEKAMLVAEILPDGSLTKDRYIIGDQEMLLNNYNLDTQADV